MGTVSTALAGVERPTESRPWTLKLYVWSVAASSLLLLLPDVGAGSARRSVFYLVLVLGVWVGSRVAWALTLALYAMTFVTALFFVLGPSLIVAGLCAVWIGLLVASPTQRWVGHGRLHALARSLPSEWRARPMTLRIYVCSSLVLSVLSIVRDPQQLVFPWILMNVASLWLLKMLWDGSAGMWWLSVLANAGYLAVVLPAGLDEPLGWVNFAIALGSLVLLVHRSTRAWFNDRIAARYQRRERALT